MVLGAWFWKVSGKKASIARGSLAMTPYPLSLAPLTIGNLGPEATIAAAAEGGYDGVGLRLAAAPGTAPAEPVIGDAARLGAIRRQLADHRLAAFSATGLWLTPQSAGDGFGPALEAAAFLGVRWFLVGGTDPDRARLADSLARLAADAARFGVGLAIEFMPYTAVATLAEAMALARGAGAAVGVVVDALHLARSGGTPAALAALPPERIAYLQLCDAPAAAPAGGTAALRRESLGGRLYPGDGALPLFPLLEALPRGLVLDLEMPVAADAALTPAARAGRAAERTRRFLAAWGAPSPVPSG